MKKKTAFAIKLIIGTVLIAYLLVFKVDLKEIRELFLNIKAVPALISFSLFISGIFISALRWQILLRHHKMSIPLKELSRSYIISIFFNHFLPTRFGGDVVRISHTKKNNSGYTKPAGIVLIERLSGITVLIGSAIIASLISPGIYSKLPFEISALIISSITGLCIFILFLIFFRFEKINIEKINSKVLRKIIIKVTEINSLIRATTASRGVILKVTLLSVLLQINVIVHYYLIGEAIGLNLGFTDYFIIIPLLLIALSFPVSINGIGVREVVLLRLIPANSPAMIVSFSFIDVIFTLILGIAGGILYMISRKQVS